MSLADDVHAAGIDVLRFVVDGVPTFVAVDDGVPATYGDPAVAEAKDDVIWGFSSEKAVSEK